MKYFVQFWHNTGGWHSSGSWDYHPSFIFEADSDEEALNLAGKHVKDFKSKSRADFHITALARMSLEMSDNHAVVSLTHIDIPESYYDWGYNSQKIQSDKDFDSTQKSVAAYFAIDNSVEYPANGMVLATLQAIFKDKSGALVKSIKEDGKVKISLNFGVE
jgi:hypothetical protein